jgi:hypothetical protein
MLRAANPRGTKIHCYDDHDHHDEQARGHAHADH